MVKIIPYQLKYQNEIDAMMREIAMEFSLPGSSPGYNPPLPEPYWLAMERSAVVGTLGIQVINRYAILKKVFLKKEFRGKDKGIAGLLLETSITRCRKENLSQIYLGTMKRFKAAHRFYEKNGFIRIAENELPPGFVSNPVDTVFYKLDL